MTVTPPPRRLPAPIFAAEGTPPMTSLAMRLPKESPRAVRDDSSWTFPNARGAIVVETTVRPAGHPDLAALRPADGWGFRDVGGGLVLAVRAGMAPPAASASPTLAFPAAPAAPRPV